MRPKQECAGSITRPPERPVRVLRVRTPGTPGTPIAHSADGARARAALPSHRAARDIDRDIVQRGDPPRPRMRCRSGVRPTVPRALEVLGSEGTRHTLAVLRDLMQYSQYRDYSEYPTCVRRTAT
jgi:hypothetical protein